MSGNITTDFIGASEVERYRKWLAKRKRTKMSQYGMPNRLTKFFKWVAEYRESKGKALSKVDEITWKDLDKYRDARVKEVKANTVKQEMNCVISYYKMRYETTLKDKEFNRYNKFKAVPKPLRVEQSIKHFTHMKIEDIELLIKIAKERRHLEPYTIHSEAYEFVVVLLYTSMRAEIYGLKVEEIDFDAGIINYMIKGGKPHVIPIHADLEQVLRAHLKDRPYKSDFVFKNGRSRDSAKNIKNNTITALRTVNRLGKLAGLENIHPHRFRKSVGSYLRHMGVDLKIIQKLLGHTNFAMTTNLYTEVTLDDVQEAFKGISFIGNGEVRPEKLSALQKIANMEPETLKKLLALVEAL